MQLISLRDNFNDLNHCCFQELKSHECFTTLTNLMWIDYGIVQG